MREGVWGAESGRGDEPLGRSRATKSTSGPPAHVDYKGEVGELRLQADLIRPRARVLLVDDWIETATQFRTARALLELAGAMVIGASVVIDETDSMVRPALGKFTALIHADDKHFAMSTTEPSAQILLGSPKRADARRNYERVPAAAREAFAEGGESTALEEIARRAGVGIGSSAACRCSSSRRRIRRHQKSPAHRPISVDD